MFVTSEEIKIGDRMRIAGMSALVTELRPTGNYIEVTGIRNGEWRREYMQIGKLKNVVRVEDRDSATKSEAVTP